KVRARFAKYRQPDWNLDVRYELAAKGEWLCALALTYQGITGALKALIARGEIMQTMLADVNYDPAAIEKFRRSPQGQALAQPAPKPQESGRPLRIHA